MAIHKMCSESQATYAIVDYPGWDRAAHGPLYMNVSHEGLVLTNDGEYNGRDDSDFYAQVWDAEARTVRRVEFASTRGWSYPNHADVDATPETLAAVEAWREEQRARYRAAQAEAEAAKVAEAAKAAALKAQCVELSKQRRRQARLGKVTGEFAWCGLSSSGKSIRVGVRDAAGKMHWGASTALVLL